MTVEVSTYISQLNSSYPAAGDPKSEGDDHIRKIKAALLANFPALTAAAVTASTTELNYVTGVTSAIQTQLNAKAPSASPTFTGTPVAPTATALTNSTQIATTAYVDAADTALGATKANIASPTFTGVPAAPTATAGTSTTQIATTAFVAATAFSSSLPAQATNANKVITTDGSNASWTANWPGNAITADKGGTGLTTLTANNLLVGAGTSNVTFIAPGTSGNVLTSNGTTWTSAAPASQGTGTGSYTTPTRALGTTYTNSGSTTRWVVFTGEYSGAISASYTVSFQAVVSGTSIMYAEIFNAMNGPAAAQHASMSFPVPAGATYSISNVGGGGSGSVTSWKEYQ